MKKQLFATQIVARQLLSPKSLLHKNLDAEALTIQKLDHEGRQWSKSHYRGGYTSYASQNQLQRQSSNFAALQARIDRVVQAYRRSLGWNLQGGTLRMTTCWLNIMPAGAQHSSHLHPLAVISGTYYLRVPAGSSGLKFEDPRLGLFMGRPPQSENAREQCFVTVPARAGHLILFESWLRHEVPAQPIQQTRISVSFNYEWD